MSEINNHNKKVGFKDCPVHNIKDDCFGVEPYVECLAEFIMKCDTPMTISVQGEWGSGKTSIMKMVEEKINNEAITIWFNTWQYSQFEMESSLPISLLSAFLEELGDKKLTQRIIGSGKKAANSLLQIAINMTTGGLLNASSDAIKDSADKILNMLEKNDLSKHIRTLRDDIAKAVNGKLEAEKESRPNCRLVIFVDDLDRLPPLVAIQALETMKNFMDTEGCVFVLAVDYEVIIEGISEKYGETLGKKKGRNFFDKIIQLPFAVPIGHYEIDNYLMNLLNCTTSSGGSVETYKQLIEKSVGFNPRSLKRLFNTYQLLIKVAARRLYDDIDIEYEPDIDHNNRVLFGALCMQTSYETLYNYMINNRDEMNVYIVSNFKEFICDNIDNRGIVNVELKKCYLEYERTDLLDSVDEFLKIFSKVIYENAPDSSDENELDIFKGILSLSSVTTRNSAAITQNTFKNKKKYYESLQEYLDDLKISYNTKTLVNNLISDLECRYNGLVEIRYTPTFISFCASGRNFLSIQPRSAYLNLNFKMRHHNTNNIIVEKIVVRSEIEYDDNIKQKILDSYNLIIQSTY